MSVGTIILIILVIALLGGFSGIGGGPFYGTGYYGGGGLGTRHSHLTHTASTRETLSGPWRNDYAERLIGTLHRGCLPPHLMSNGNKPPC